MQIQKVLSEKIANNNQGHVNEHDMNLEIHK